MKNKSILIFALTDVNILGENIITISCDIYGVKNTNK